MDNRTSQAPALSRRAFLAGAGIVALGGLAGFGFRSFASGEQAQASDALAAGRAAEAAEAAADAVDAGMLRTTVFSLDTVIDLGVYGTQDDLDAAAAACERYHGLFSSYDEGTDLWRINHAQGALCTVSPETIDLIQRALAFSEASGGAFDITIGAVSLLWDFKAGVKPSDEAIQEGLSHVDWHGVTVDAQACTVQLVDPQAALDVGGIAKGWIADALADLWRQRGVTSGIINLGGNVYALGSKPSGRAWEVGIRDPTVSAGASVATVEVRDRSVVTSGLYERHFIAEDGRDYHHILDPHTGYPVETDLRGATVVSERSLEGDGLSTTLFIYGSDRALEAAGERAGVDALLMTEGTRTLATPGFEDYRYTRL